ncbi:tetratricopeptide repeat protein [Nocardia sp. NBC_01009]|uniref:tetratricopeptide repeat protein n=1 Tax=Nocardia sp. NBC_01009 TaxID=2975996 RepID=UPI003863F954|nr:tetratricopeptide repeat protein [Nocardia sp. NBC_01009]
MGGRLALIVGSECDALAQLGFTDELATRLYDDLRRLGGWQSATADDGPLLNPTISQLKSAVNAAFAAAARQQATLLISFIGHGQSTIRDQFYLLARDSDPAKGLDSDTAFNLGHTVLEKLVPARLDGLIVLVDACEADAGARAAHGWTEGIDPRSGRIELLAASSNGNAYGGCFTRTMLETFKDGLPQQGTYLLPSDLRPHIAAHCTRQTPRQFSTAVGGDPGLWLVPNASRIKDAVFGRPSAGFIDQLINGPAISSTLCDRAEQVYADNAHRLRTVIGPAGCGKSTLMALLIRPTLLPEATFNSKYITAAVFLDLASTIESLTQELSTQLSSRLKDYATAVATVAQRYDGHDGPRPDSTELLVLLPLELTKPRYGQTAIIIDGLDQPEDGAKRQILALLGELTNRATLSHIRVIVGIREGTETETSSHLAGQHTHYLTAPTDYDIIATVRQAHGILRQRDGGPEWRQWLNSLMDRTSAGGWLLARLMTEIPGFDADDINNQIQLGKLVQRRVHAAVKTSGPDSSQPIGAILGVLAAAGTGPVLPLTLLHAALPALGIHTHTSQIRDLIANLGVLISRSNPGTPEENLGLAHTDFLAPIHEVVIQLDIQVTETHHAILTAIRTAASEATGRYARTSAVRHLLAIGDSSSAVTLLRTLDTADSADNRQRWATWLPLFIESLGPDHPDTLIARNNLAARRGESGDLAGAINDLTQLLADQRRVLGPDDPITFAIRNNLASWRGESGDLAGAINELTQLLADQRRVMSPDHPDTMRVRHNLAARRGESGDLAGAINDTEQLLTDQLRVAGPDHPATLSIRHTLALRQGDVGDLAGAINNFEQLLTDQLRMLGPDHPDTLATRNNLASRRGESGDLAGAITDLTQLLADRRRISGPDHPATLITRGNLASWRSESGDLAGAITDIEQLLTDQLRVLGPNHPDTLTTRHNLASWRGRNGDIAGAINDIEQLLTDQLRVAGPDHPDTLTTRSALASLRGDVGDLTGAINDTEQLLTDQLRVAGPDHPDTLTTRNNLASWRGRNGDIAGAINDFEQLLTDRLRVLGPNHPDTLTTRHNLASWRRRNGDLAGAINEFEHLLTDQLRVAGPDHPDTLATRSALASLRGDVGDIADAINDFEQLLTDRLRVLGPNHPHTLTSRHNLATLRGQSGDIADAINDFEQLLTDRLRVLGPNHPDTLTTRNNLATLRGQSGDIAGAINDFEQLLMDYLRVLGPDHPHTLTSRHNLEQLRRRYQQP